MYSSLIIPGRESEQTAFDALEGVKRAAKNKDLHFEVILIEKMPSGRLWNWLKRRYSFWRKGPERPCMAESDSPQRPLYSLKILKEKKMKFYPQEIVEITQAEMQKTECSLRGG